LDFQRRDFARGGRDGSLSNTSAQGFGLRMNCNAAT
jgi:hypothetical protein